MWFWDQEDKKAEVVAVKRRGRRWEEDKTDDGGGAERLLEGPGISSVVIRVWFFRKPTICIHFKEYEIHTLLGGSKNQTCLPGT